MSNKHSHFLIYTKHILFMIIKYINHQEYFKFNIFKNKNYRLQLSTDQIFIGISQMIKIEALKLLHCT